MPIAPIAPCSVAVSAAMLVAGALVPTIRLAQRIESKQPLLVSVAADHNLGGDSGPVDSGQPSLATAMADIHRLPVGNPPFRTMPGLDRQCTGISVPGSPVGGKRANA